MPRKPKLEPTKRGNGRGSISAYKGRYRWQYRNAEGKTLASGIAATKTEAENALTKAKADKLRGILASPDQITLNEYADKWLERLTVRGVTKLAYRREIDLIRPALGKKRLKDLKPITIKDALTALAATNAKRFVKGEVIDTGKPLSSRTIAHVRTRLRSILREAVTDQIIYVSPADSVKPIKKQRTENPHIALDFDQASQLQQVGDTLWKAGNCRLWVAIFTALSVGLRKSEVMALTWADVDFEKKLLHIRRAVTLENNKPSYHERNKSDTSKRDIFIGESLVAALLEHRAKQDAERVVAGDAWQNTNAVFATATGNWTHPDNLPRAITDVVRWSNWDYYATLDPKKIMRGHRVIKPELRPGFEALLKDGEPLPKLTPHDLRHTAGTLMLRKKVPVEVVSKILGHADIAITYRVYRHVLESEKREHVIDLFPMTVKVQAANISAVN
jgi:integrase